MSFRKQLNWRCFFRSHISRSVSKKAGQWEILAFLTFQQLYWCKAQSKTNEILCFDDFFFFFLLILVFNYFQFIICESNCITMISIPCRTIELSPFENTYNLYQIVFTMEIFLVLVNFNSLFSFVLLLHVVIRIICL